mgnify:CR=1 FL=1
MDTLLRAQVGQRGEKGGDARAARRSGKMREVDILKNPCILPSSRGVCEYRQGWYACPSAPSA